jgi:hypothetical protein
MRAHEVLRPDYYQDLLASVPPPGEFRVADRHKLDFEPLAAGSTSESTRMWRRFETEVVDAQIVPRLVPRFADAIRWYFDWQFGELAAEVAQLPLRSRGGRLMLRRPGYRLKPHCDTQIAVLTGLLYFARPGDDAAFGTELYRVDPLVHAPSMKTCYPQEFGASCELAATVAFTPNTLLAFVNARLAHAAHIPADATQQERLAYQFYVSPDEERLAAIVRRAPAVVRQRWSAMKGTS